MCSAPLPASRVPFCCYEAICIGVYGFCSGVAWASWDSPWATRCWWPICSSFLSMTCNSGATSRHSLGSSCSSMASYGIPNDTRRSYSGPHVRGHRNGLWHLWPVLLSVLANHPRPIVRRVLCGVLGAGCPARGTCVDRADRRVANRAVRGPTAWIPADSRGNYRQEPHTERPPLVAERGLG